MIKQKPFNNVLKEWKIYLISVIPIGFIVSGGIASLLGKQSIFDFINIFIWYSLFQFRLFDYIIGLEKKVDSGKDNLSD